MPPIQHPPPTNSSNKSSAGKINELFSHSLSVDIPLSGGRPDRVRWYRDRTNIPLVQPSLSEYRSPKTSLARIICALRCRRRCNQHGQLINSYLGTCDCTPVPILLYSRSNYPSGDRLKMTAVLYHDQISSKAE